jgi:hypothetical protein
MADNSWPLASDVRAIRRHLVNGSLVIFAGSGVSAPLLPTWKTLAELLLEEATARTAHGDVLKEARDYLAERRYVDAFTALEHALGETTFRSAVMDALSDEALEPTETALAIAALSPKLRAVITTNLDTILERAFGGRWPAISRATVDLPSRRAIIWKPHGTLPEPQTWIFTRNQYDRLIFDEPAHQHAMRTFFSSFHLLFCGFGLADDDFDQTIAQLRQWSPGANTIHYGLLPAAALPPVRRQRLENLGIRCLAYPNSDGAHRAVPEFLRSLNAAGEDEPAEHPRAPRPRAEMEITPQPSEFIGRDFLFNAVDQFLDANAPGYLFILGDPGVGKTWFARELIRRRAPIFHYNSRPDNLCSTDYFLRNVCGQLALRAGIGAPPIATEETFRELLKNVGSRNAGGRLLIVLDAVDEADPPSQDSMNVLCLPRALPENVTFVVTSQRFSAVNPMPLVENGQVFDISEDPRHKTDARIYIERFLSLHGPAFDSLLTSRHMERSEFVEMVLTRSEANFMYLSIALPAMAAGALTPESMTDIDLLPLGLREYYRRHWTRMAGTAGPRFAQEKAVICMLAAAREPLTVPVIVKALGSGSMVIREALHKWQALLRKGRGPEGVPVWSIYHASFQAFLRDEVGLDSVEDEFLDRALDVFRKGANGSL